MKFRELKEIRNSEDIVWKIQSYRSIRYFQNPIRIIRFKRMRGTQKILLLVDPVLFLHIVMGLVLRPTRSHGFYDQQ